MSFKKNIIASYASQIYVTLIGIVALPVYIKYMGAEAYGLVGFFSMLQVWFNLLDMGLTPTMTRETARFKSEGISAIDYKRLVRALQIIFLSIATLGGSVLVFSSAWVAERWLKTEVLPLDQVQTSLQLMALCIALRWMSGLYRACIIGAEKLVWLGSFNSLVATLRFAGVVPFLIFIEASPKAFFFYQAIIAVFEVAGLWRKSSGLFSPVLKPHKIGWSIPELFLPIASVLKFSITVSFTSLVWVFITQVDKLVLSKMLSLKDYGIFTLAVLAASGVTMISGPISNAIMPRITRLHSQGKNDELIRLYRNSSQAVGIIAIPVCLTLSFFSDRVLMMWTGDVAIASNASFILCLYSLGNGFLVFSAFPYYLQFAKGDLRLHILGNLLFLVVLVPLLILATWKYGVSGAAGVWFAFNGIYFFAWVPLVHARFDKELHKKWLLKDLLPVSCVGLVAQTFFLLVIDFSNNRFEIASKLVLIGTVTLMLCASCSKEVRGFLILSIMNVKNRKSFNEQ